MPVPGEDATLRAATVRAELERLAHECALCYQCGTCTSSCPNGLDLTQGPRRIVRAVLARDADAVLGSDDLWRCTGCGACSEACRMQIDVAAVLRALRRLERDCGMPTRCPERAAAGLASAQLKQATDLNMMRFGLGMAARGYVPRDKPAAARIAVRLTRQRLQGSQRESKSAVHGGSTATATRLPFYAGCALRQDHRLLSVVSGVAAGFGVRLEDVPVAGCCGHPTRGAVGSRFASDERVATVCPACDTSLERSGVHTTPLWNVLTAEARRRGLRMQGSAPRFVPYVGCLSDRSTALAALGDAAELAGTRPVTSHPSLHAGCCGALGGTYRGATAASARLLDYADREAAPIVTPCSMCADNLRSAARELNHSVAVYFWPEFFRAASDTAEEPHHE